MRGRLELRNVVATVAALTCVASGSIAVAADPVGATPPAWSVVSAAIGRPFAHVSCANGGTCVVLSQSAQADPTLSERATWDGTAWTLSPLPALGAADDSYTAVSCPSASNCYAVGYDHNLALLPRRSVAQHWNGVSWTALAVPHPGATRDELLGVSCISNSNCVAVGFFDDLSSNMLPLIERWNGIAWSIEAGAASNPAGILNGVSCASASLCVATGGSLIERFDGAQWSVDDGATFAHVPNLISVSCGGPAFCVAVGQDPFAGAASVIEHWDGSSWTADTGSGFDPTGYVLGSVACPSAGRCAAVGSSFSIGGGGVVTSTQAIDMWDGATWSQQPNPAAPPVQLLGDVACFAVDSCLAAGIGSTSNNISGSPVALLESDLASVPGLPGAPTGVHATTSGNSITVSWTPASGNGSPVTSYTVAPSHGLKPAGVAAAHATFSNVAPGTYTFTVRATNASGTGAPSAPSNAVTVVATSARKVGYWMLGADGHVYAFGTSAFGSARGPAVAIAPRRDGQGYWVTDAVGGVAPFGAAHDYGGHPFLHLGERVSTISATPSGNGYWLFTNRGRAFGFGDARFFGDMSAVALNGSIVASVATPTGRGYYMVGSDGGVFTFGDARFHGSTGGLHLNRPVVGIAPTPDNRGYWLVASDGGVFAFDAPFRGSMGGAALNKAVNGLVAFGRGYLMVASDGGVFDFSDKPFLGSLAANPPAAPIIAIAAFSVA